MTHDVLVIGGSYAGMAAALQLVRARRRVLVVDAGRPRNRAAHRSHGFLGQDGADPAAIAAVARRQLEAYPTLDWIDGRVERIGGSVDDFAAVDTAGATHRARRLLLAGGVADGLPPIPGLAERWGRSVFHCPYCHGYELDRGRIGVVASGPLSLHQAELVAEWGEVTLFVEDAVVLDDATWDALARRGIAIEPGRIARIDREADVVLVDGRTLPFAGLFVASRTSPADGLATSLGCAIEETVLGTQVRVDAEGRSSVPGVHACGDLARVPHSVSLTVGHGAFVGAMVHRSLVWPETTPGSS